ncbi:secreted protein [Alloactinosynnema sp. L-07]|uniref:DM13 domain-containing protein n=1 Tax=Alloactinosynnema sp. L-07 TaxID=1653480 RepID=UPI00065EF2C8|nr:DM13 domain-containing protein [Alloactinosynnema sp. L-07]CRK60826.1 secreted protein [Alloactinosynnema sp. L-07]
MALAIALVLLAGGLWAFQPWKLFTHSTVDEALPAGFQVAATSTTAAPTTTAAADPTAPTLTAPTTTVAGPKVLAEGAFVNAEHKTSGTARLLEQNGARLLRLEGFSTSDGPDVHVWLSATKSGSDWKAYDDGHFVKLGKLKATDGNQNYTIPADADLTGINSVVIWCDRFNVAFGSAPLSL